MGGEKMLCFCFVRGRWMHTCSCAWARARMCRMRTEVWMKSQWSQWKWNDFTLLTFHLVAVIYYLIFGWSFLDFHFFRLELAYHFCWDMWFMGTVSHTNIPLEQLIYKCAISNWFEVQIDKTVGDLWLNSLRIFKMLEAMSGHVWIRAPTQYCFGHDDAGIP